MRISELWVMSLDQHPAATAAASACARARTERAVAGRVACVYAYVVERALAGRVCLTEDDCG